jgi:hypothetical protein
VTGGAVFAYDPGVLQFGPFLTVTPTVSSAVLPQAGVSLAGSFGRGNVPRGFFGTSSTGILNSGLGDFTLSVDYTQNNNYDGLGASAGLGIESLPSYSFTNGSETYGVSDLITIDGGAAMEDVYNALLRASQDPFGGAHF